MSARRLAPLVVAALLLLPGLARAEELIVDLSQHLVAITTGFTGADVLLFGAADQGEDLIVIVRGPPTRTVVRRKDRVVGIWINQDRMVFPRAPAFYHVAASGDMAGQAVADVLEAHEVGADFLQLRPRDRDMQSPDVEDFREALIRNKQRMNLYSTQAWPVTFIGQRLFRTTIPFPANVPTGTYQIEVHSVKDGDIVSSATTPLVVSKTGFGATIYDFAHDHSAAYGVIAILTAAMAGWAAGSIFRRA